MHGITNIFTKDENAIHNTEMRILENDLIPVYETNSGEKVVYGTELHAGLGSPSVYREWAKRRLSDVDAVENEDYTTVEIPTVSGGLKLFYQKPYSLFMPIRKLAVHFYYACFFFSLLFRPILFILRFGLPPS